MLDEVPKPLALRRGAIAMDRKLVVRNAKTGRFITVTQAMENPEAIIFEEKRDGKIQRYRPRPIQDGELESGRYMLLDPVTVVATK